MTELEKSLEEKIKRLDRQVERLEEIKYKYYCLGFMYFFMLGMIFLMSPSGLGNLGSSEFNSNMSIILFFSLIFFTIIFFGEIIIRIFQAIFKSKKSA